MEGLALLVEGKLSVRDEKPPQLMCDRVKPLTEQVGMAAASGSKENIPGRLFVKLPTAEDPRMRKLSLVLNMFPGTQQVVLYCADTGKRLGTVAQIHPALLGELREMFGVENVVVK